MTGVSFKEGGRKLEGPWNKNWDCVTNGPSECR